MTLSQLKKACKKKGNGFCGYFTGGELFVNDKDGKTVWQKEMGWEDAEALCDSLKITLTEV